MGLWVVDEDVAREVEHLDALVSHHVEALSGLVGREGDVASRGMPVGIDHGTAQQFVLGLQPFALAVLLNHGGAVVATHVEDKLVGVGAVGGVAVEAGSGSLGVLNDGLFGEVGEVALVEPHVAVHLIARCDASVGEAPFVEGIGADCHGEVLILRPLSVSLHAGGERELRTAVLLQQRVPVVDVEVGPLAVGIQFATLAAAHGDVDDIGPVVARIAEVERCDAHGNGDAHVVGIDRGHLVFLHDVAVGSLFAAGGEQQDGQQKTEN